MSTGERDVHHMLKQLGRALVDAAARSNEVTEAVRRIRKEGYSLYLVVDPSRQRPQGPQLELTTRPRREVMGEPAFRLDGDDVAFLRSIGVDPTRPAARRRRNQGT